jgi:hypothetical protein
MALSETYRPWIIFESWYCIRRPISLHRIILFDVDSQLCSIKVLLSAFAYLARINRITSARSSSHCNLVCTLRGMAPTPHAIMPRSWKMWLKASFASVGLSISCVYCKSTWNLSHSKNACLLALAIAFH